jgi:hypothetical protein
MSMEQVQIITALLNLCDKLSSWPFALALFVFTVGPWLLALFIAHAYSKRHQEVVQMYENNVRLVEKYQEIAGDLKDVIVMNTQAFTRLEDAIEKNQFCPAVRLKKDATGIVMGGGGQ